MRVQVGAGGTGYRKSAGNGRCADGRGGRGVGYDKRKH
jgi:hypothetical protein